MAKNNELKNGERIATTLGRETNFRGTMHFQESLKIVGRFEGEIVSPGFLYVEQGAVIKANIRVSSIVVGGTVRGNIEASDKLEMLSTGQVVGNIKTSKLKIADGVVFEGKCEMIKSPERIDIFSAKAESVKEAAQSV